MVIKDKVLSSEAAAIPSPRVVGKRGADLAITIRLSRTFYDAGSVKMSINAVDLSHPFDVQKL